MMQDLALLVLGMLLCSRLDTTEGHGRMVEPAARNSMWRYNYKNPRNYNDMGLNCGGFTNQFERNGGRCGVCGDPWEGPRDHEAGGKYARGLVARQYRVGSLINVTVELTSNHMGYFEFRLCPVNDPHKKATQACLDRHVLNILGHGSRFFISMKEMSRFEEVIVMLPPNLQCSQCVLQWKWVAGQSMGPDGYGGECLGCGNQEHFINCADIAIGPKAVKPLSGPLPPSDPAPPSTNLGPGYDVSNNGYGSKTATGYDVRMGGGSNNAISQNGNYKHVTKKAYAASPVTSAPAWAPQPRSNPSAIAWKQPVEATNWNQAQAPSWNQPTTTTGWQDFGAGSWNGINHLLGLTNNEAPINDYPTHGAHSDYGGLEPGEYPEVGEGQPAEPSHGLPYNSGSTSDSSYMQGFNDAIRKLTQGLVVGGTSPYANKGSGVLAEVTRTFQESAKFSGGGFNGAACPDGTEPTCKAIGQSTGSTEFDSWCTNTCSNGECPPGLCSCTCTGSGSSGADWWPTGSGSGYCRSVDQSQAASMDKWCQLNCKQNNCPSHLCTCN